jgi:hypothetical protein
LLIKTQIVEIWEEPSNNADNEDNFERSKNITELVSSDSVVAVKAEDDNIEYYMLIFIYLFIYLFV